MDFNKVFDTVSHSILLEKLATHGLDVYSLLGEELAGWTGSKSHCEGNSNQLAADTSDVSRGSVPGPVLVTIFISDLDSVD